MGTTDDLQRQHETAVTKACALIQVSSSMLNLSALAQAAHMSPSHFHRVFVSVTGVTPKEYANAHRAKRMKGVLRKSATVTDAMYRAGFNSSGRFYSASSSVLGMTPTAYRAGGKGSVIRFAVGECSLGSFIVAATETGICSIMLDDDPDVLVRELQDRFPKARLIGGDKTFEKLVANVVGLVEHPARAFTLPLDIQGTAFQQRVWQALRKIPAGTTATYAEIAKRIGKPRSVRAVAAACAANKIAIVIPCHRVVRTDGSLSGYRWGIQRKKVLLERESP